MPLEIYNRSFLPSAPTYTGPGNAVVNAGGADAFAWWGLRSYNAAYATGSNPAADLVNSSGTGYSGNPIKILSSGAADAVAIAAAIAGGFNLISQLYDQTSNGRHLTSPSTAVNRPTITAAGLNGGTLPSINTSDTVDNQVMQTAAVTLAQPYTFYCMCDLGADNGRYMNITGTNIFTLGVGGTIFRLSGGVDVLDQTTNFSPSFFLGLYNSGLSVNSLNGSEVIPGPAIGTLGFAGDNIRLWSNSFAPGGVGVQGDTGECGIWASGLGTTADSTIRAALRTNVKNYWGTV